MGLAQQGQGGQYVEEAYKKLMAQHASSAGSSSSSSSSSGSGSTFPINTHGGLLGQGAPWEAPAMYSLVEAVQQLRGQAGGRQVQGARRALVYGNGGVFSASAVAILERAGAVMPSKL